MLPEDTPVKEQFTLEHFQPTNRAEPLASYFPERVPEEIAEEPPEEIEAPPSPPPVKNNFFPNLFKLLTLFTFIVTIVATIVIIYRRETSRAIARQLNRTLATNLTAVDASLVRVDTALADLLLAAQKTALTDSALATDKAVKSGKIAVIQSWQNLDVLNQTLKSQSPATVAGGDGGGRPVERLDQAERGKPSDGTSRQQAPRVSDIADDVVPPTETYLTETQKAFGYFEQFSALQEKAAAILAALAAYQNNSGTDTSLTASALNNFAAGLTTIKMALSDLNDNLPFALSSFHEENLRSITTWLSLLGNVNAAVYEKDQDKTMTATLQLVTSLNSWTAQSRSLAAEFFRANKTLQKYFYLAPLYQSTIASLQLSP